MAVLLLLLNLLLFCDFGSAFLVARGNVTTNLPPLKQSKKQGTGVLKVPLSKPSPTPLSKRDDIKSLENVNNGYLITCSIGTPPQLVYTQIDTGSSDLWVDPTCANANDPSYCEEFPVYYPGNSSTVSDADEELSITYGTGSVSGEYLVDNVVLGSANIEQQQFGWSETSSYVNNGIMGIGLGYGWTTDYYNIIDQLYVQGFTNSRAFSLDLQSIDVADGSVIFGGIDTMKYIGALHTSPMIPYYDAPDGFPRYWFYMTSVGITQPGKSTVVLTDSTYNQAMFPDCGATLSQLPPNLFAALISYFPTAVSVGNGVYTIDCSIRSQVGTIDFGFGTTIIHVSYHEWFWQAGSTCYFGGVSNADTWSLGDSFIRSAYIVYDQDNFNIHIAPAANCGTNVIPIGSGVNAVPSSVGACTSTSTTATVSSSSTSKASTSTSSKPSSSTKSSSSSKITASSTVSSTKVSTTSLKSSTTSKSTSSSKVSSTSKSTSSSKSSSTSKSTSSSKSSSTLKTSTTSKKSSSSTSKPVTTTSKSTSKTSTVTPTKTTSTSSKSSSQSSTTSKTSSSTKPTTTKHTTTFVSSYTSSGKTVVTTITKK